VNLDYKLVLDEQALSTLLACRSAERLNLLQSLQSLKRDPLQKGDYIERDDTGHDIQVKVFGHYLLSYWLDGPVSELRVVDIERIRPKA